MANLYAASRQICLLASSLFSLFLLSTNAFANESCQLIPITLAERASQAQLIVEGEVVSQQSFWDARHENIYTSNIIRVYKVFKGDVPEQLLEVITEGGAVGLEMHVFSSALKLKKAQQGIFFLSEQGKLKSTPGNRHISTRAYSDQQGFIDYNLKRGTAQDPFNAYASVQEVYSAITGKTGVNFRIVSENTQLLKATTDTQARDLKILAAAAITSFTPTTASAGTGTVLTINGSGFGATRGTGYVEFRNADDGGTTFIEPLPADYVSWSNTQIRVRIPSAGEDGGTAGTGVIRVTAADGSTTTSAAQLTIPYSYINFEYEGTTAQPILVGMNAAGGYTLSFAPSMRAALAPQEGFRRAMNSWICSTNVNWQLDQGTNVESSTSDGLSVIRFAPGSDVGERTLARTISRYQGCQNRQTGAIEWSVSEFDMELNAGISWEYGPGAPTRNRYDYETVVLHELGHAHQLGHVISARTNPPTTAVMHYAVETSVQYRSLSAADIEGANAVISNSQVQSRVALATGCNSSTPFVLKTDGDCAIASEITSFTAEFNTSGTVVDLAWTTSSTRNLDFFVVQRSENGSDWNDISTVDATGSNSYTFADTAPLPRTSYYRLQAVYTTEETLFSYRVRVINPNDLRRLVAFPNPINQETQDLQLEYIVEESSEVSIQLYDYTGRLHRKVTLTFTDLNAPATINVGNLAAGMYILKWTEGTRSGEVKVVKL